MTKYLYLGPSALNAFNPPDNQLIAMIKSVTSTLPWHVAHWNEKEPGEYKKYY